MERAQVARETPTALVVRPVTEVAGVQRISGSPTPPGRGPGQMPQTIPEIPMYAFGRGRGAVLIAQRYNIQMREHFLQYYAHLTLQQQLQQQQEQLYQQQQQVVDQHQAQLQQFEEFQDSMNQLVGLPAGLPELIPIDSNFEDIDED
jgi:hypothetical protein